MFRKLFKKTHINNLTKSGRQYKRKTKSSTKRKHFLKTPNRNFGPVEYSN